MNMNTQNEELISIDNEISKNPDDRELKIKKILKTLEIAYETLLQSHDKALPYFKTAMELSQQIEYNYGLGKTNHLLAMSNYYIMNYNIAIDFYKIALSYYEKCNSMVEIAAIYNNLGLVFTALNQYKQAKESYFKALEIYKIYPSDLGLSNSYNNLGIVNKYLRKYDLAIEYYKKDLEISEKTNNEKNIARAHNNLAAIYIHKNEYKLALTALKKSIHYHIQTNNLNGLVFNYLIYGNICYETNKKKAAYRFLGKAQALAKTINNKKALISALEMKAKFYANDGQYRKSILYYKKYNEMIISKFSEENAQKLAELQNQIEKQDTEKNAIKATAIATSHELRQPLMILQANMEMMFLEMEKYQNLTPFLKYQEKISQSVDRMQNTLQKLTDFNNIDYDIYTNDIKMLKI